jgi:two-component system, sensor histidine kinase and response regulator
MFFGVPQQGASAGRVLVVDDSLSAQLILQTVLEQEGYEVTLVENGVAAIACVEQLLPDLVILDVLLPELDGYEVTRRLRQNLALPYIPILLVTSYDEPDVVQGLDIGADDFLKKPISVRELRARVRALIRLRKSLKARERLARQQEDFVSRLTHDLRTPLVAIGRMLMLLREGAWGEVAPEMADAIVTMERSNQTLLQLVNNLLEVYRYEASRKNLAMSRVNLRELIQDVAQELSPLIQERGLSLQLDLAPGVLNSGRVSVEVMGDRLELRRVLMNLVANAIQFTEVGRITIRLRMITNLTKSHPQSIARVEVEDTGIGIAPTEQALIFDRFQQGRYQSTGSGLGLHLSRLIVEAHQGRIEVSSLPGRGSTFRIDIPLPSVELDEPEAESQS